MKPTKNFDSVFKIVRTEYFDDTTIGNLYGPSSDKLCWTLEDAVRADGVKVPKKTAIPSTGLMLAYSLDLRFSPRFNRKMPVIYSEKRGDEYIVRGRGGVTFSFAQIHGGNTHSNTEGCPLVAYRRPTAKTIQGTAEKEITMLLEDALLKGSVGLVILNAPQENTIFA